MSVDALRADLQMIADAAQWHASNFVFDNEPDREDLTASLADFMGVYCQTAALLTSDWYNAADRESRFFARPVAVVPPERARDTAAWVFGVLNPTTPGVARRAASAAYTMVFDAARDTVTTNAVNEGVAYVRVEERSACGDCKERATLVPRARNSSSEDVPWDRHQRCEFLFQPVRTGIWTPPEYAQEWRIGNQTEAGVAK